VRSKQSKYSKRNCFTNSSIGETKAYNSKYCSWKQIAENDNNNKNNRFLMEDYIEETLEPP